MSRLSILILLVPIILLSGCKKEGSSSQSKTQLITSSAWKFQTAGIDNDNNGTIDIAAPSAYLESCDTDNLVTFSANFTGTVDEGPSKCDVASPQTTTFVWSFKNNETELSFPGELFAGITGDVKIIELTTTKLTLSKQLVIPGFPITIPVPVVVVMTH